MKIKVLSIADDRLEAWKFSRPCQGDLTTDPSTLDGMDFSLHSLRRYTFQVEMARVMLDLIANFTKNIWSQSSRVIPVEAMVLDQEPDVFMYYPNSVANLRKAKEIARSMTQDKARLFTPIFTRLGWSFSMDHRTFIGFLKSLKELQPYLFNLYGMASLRSVGLDEEYLDKSPCGSIVSVPDGLFQARFSNIGAKYVEGVAEDTYNFISQLNRHADTTILTSLWLMPIEEMDKLIMASKIPYYYNMNLHVYKSKILSHRACWIADWGNWAHRVSEHYTADEIRNLIPCKCDGSKCLFKPDLEARIKGTDPNPPCPIFTGDPTNLTDRINREGSNFLTEAYKSLI